MPRRADESEADIVFLMDCRKWAESLGFCPSHPILHLGVPGWQYQATQFPATSATNSGVDLERPPSKRRESGRLVVIDLQIRLEPQELGSAAEVWVEVAERDAPPRRRHLLCQAHHHHEGHPG